MKQGSVKQDSKSPSMLSRAGAINTTLIRCSLILGLLPVFSQPVLAEGGVRLLDCHQTSQCNTDGRCEANSAAVQFRLSPQSLDEGGAGQYTLLVQGTESSMQALSEIGPFYWTSAQNHHTLLASSETRFVWHTLKLAAKPEGITRFLDCTFQQ